LAEAHCNLGLALQNQGKFTHALAALRRGHELGSQKPAWPYPSANWVRRGERLVALESRLPTVLKGDMRAADAVESLGLAEVCGYKQHFATAARFYREAFARDGKPAEDPNTGHRYNAACFAALAGCGRGLDAGTLDAAARAKLRQQARDWLTADLALWAKQLAKNTPQVRAAVRQTLQHWQTDRDLAGLRAATALAHLPPEEREACRQLWADVAALLKQAQEKK
jgi:serine/threonine-protein kinase